MCCPFYILGLVQKAYFFYLATVDVPEKNIDKTALRNRRILNDDL